LEGECCNCVQHRSAAECSKEFPMGVPHKKKNKKSSVLSVLFFVCESALGCTWGLGLERVLLSQTL
jgi:hypothetical protein